MTRAEAPSHARAEIMTLQEFIAECFPEGLEYDKVTQLCTYLHCVLEFIPPKLRPVCKIEDHLRAHDQRGNR